MAKTSQVVRQERRKKQATLHAERRAELKKKILDTNVEWEEKLRMVRKLDEMPRDGSRTRQKNRCVLTGRARGYMRRFGVSRIKFREMASAGVIPGITKSSW